jgi:hypothetical protein
MYEDVEVNSALTGGKLSASSSNPFTLIIFWMRGSVCSSLLEKEVKRNISVPALN